MLALQITPYKYYQKVKQIKDFTAIFNKNTKLLHKSPEPSKGHEKGFLLRIDFDQILTV